MSKVSYEILTEVHKTFSHKTLRAYVVTAQIIVKGMTAHNFAQLGILQKGTETMAVFPLKERIPTTKELTSAALKTAITERITAVKKRFEKKLQPEKEPVTLTALGNYKDTLTKIEALSEQK